MNSRSGPSWDAIEGRLPLPRAAQPRWAWNSSTPMVRTAGSREDFTDPTGNVLGPIEE